MPADSEMSPAVTTCGPFAEIESRLGPSTSIRIATPLRLRTTSVTSSRTPAMDENSCSTLSIWTLVIAAPCSELISTRRSALPSVRPKPRSSGSATTVAWRSGSLPGFTSSCDGLMSSCQFLWIMGVSSIPARRPCPKRPTPEVQKTMRAARTGLARSGIRNASDPAALRRPAAVVGNGCDVANGRDVEADGGQRAQGAFASRTGALDLDFEGLHTVLLRLPAGVLGRHLGGVGGRLPRALEAHGAGRRPGNRVALHIGDQDPGVVEGRVHMRHPGGDVLRDLLLRAACIACHVSCPPLVLLAGDGACRTLARARIGVCALAAHGKVPAVPEAAVAAEVHQPLHVHLRLAAQIALDGEVRVDMFADREHLGVGKLVHPARQVDVGRLADGLRGGLADTGDVGERDGNALGGRNVDAGDACHVWCPFVASPSPQALFSQRKPGTRRTPGSGSFLDGSGRGATPFFLTDSHSRWGAIRGRDRSVKGMSRFVWALAGMTFPGPCGEPLPRRHARPRIAQGGVRDQPSRTPAIPSATSSISPSPGTRCRLPLQW